MIFGLFWLNMNLVKGSRELFFTSAGSIKKWYWFNRTNWTTFEIISNFHNRVYRKETDSLISWQKNSITKWSGWKIAIAFWDHLKSWRKNKNWRNYEFNWIPPRDWTKYDTVFYMSIHFGYAFVCIMLMICFYYILIPFLWSTFRWCIMKIGFIRL